MAGTTISEEHTPVGFVFSGGEALLLVIMMIAEQSVLWRRLFVFPWCARLVLIYLMQAQRT